MTIHSGYVGKRLIQRGFQAWFLYLFHVIEGAPFIVEPIHQGLFDSFSKLCGGKLKRLNINIPPRAGKTTLAKYLVVYALTINPKANIIYTSFSQSLLSDIASGVKFILEHPGYKALYQDVCPGICDISGKNSYTAKKITTSQGGICLFTSIGSQITGYGAGLRNSTGFGGVLIIDDPNKPADIHSELIRTKVARYFEETLLSRLNNSDVPIVNIQQRLHPEDLSGVLIRKYGFVTVKRPLLDENGVCQLPSQYSAERIKELQLNNYMFQAQFQQEPIEPGGAVIKRKWFGFFNPELPHIYKRIVIAADTAMSVKESADFSCFLVGGVTADGRLHILRMCHGKFEYPQLKMLAVRLFNWSPAQAGSPLSLPPPQGEGSPANGGQKVAPLPKSSPSPLPLSPRGRGEVPLKVGEGKVPLGSRVNALYIENKSSGVQLIQDLRKLALPVIPIEVTKDKLARVEEVLEYIASGLVMLPGDENYAGNPVFLAECEAFSRDMSHKHDDIVDTLVHLINCTIANRKVSILDVL